MISSLGLSPFDSLILNSSSVSSVMVLTFLVLFSAMFSTLFEEPAMGGLVFIAWIWLEFEA